MMLSAYLPTERQHPKQRGDQTTSFPAVDDNAFVEELGNTEKKAAPLHRKTSCVRGMRVTELFTTVFFSSSYTFRWFDKLIYGAELDVGLL